MNKKWLVLALILVGVLLSLVFFFKSNRENKGELILYGNVDVRQVNLGFRVPGRVALMPFQEGDLVQPGDVMGVLDPQPYLDKVKEAEAFAASVRIDLANSEKVQIRREELQGSGGVSQEDYDNSTATEERLRANLDQAMASLGVALTNLEDTHIMAPTEGTILTRIREPGSVVKEGDPIYSLSILSPVWIRAFVSEPDLGRIFPNMRAMIFTDSGRSYEGHIGFISPVSEFTPKTVETTKLRVDLVYRLRITADNPDHYLKQGMPVTVKLYDSKE